MSNIFKLCNDKHTTIRIRGRRGRDRMVVGFKTVAITTKIVSSNPHVNSKIKTMKCENLKKVERCKNSLSSCLG
jgi:hypothetical protein